MWADWIHDVLVRQDARRVMGTDAALYTALRKPVKEVNARSGIA